MVLELPLGQPRLAIRCRCITGLAAPGQVRRLAAGSRHAPLPSPAAHLRGQPLHPALLQTGARFVRTCRTAPRYRFVGLLDLSPPRPGLVRDGDGPETPGAIAVERYDLPLAGFGALVASVAPPLAIGTIELEDGEALKGFLCESWAAARGQDITAFGGWLAFREHLEQARFQGIGPVTVTPLYVRALPWQLLKGTPTSCVNLSLRRASLTILGGRRPCSPWPDSLAAATRLRRGRATKGRDDGKTPDGRLHLHRPAR